MNDCGGRASRWPDSRGGCRYVSLVMEAVAELDVDFARIVPVEAAEGDAVVEFDATVGYVHGVYRSCEALAEIFAQSEIECRVRGQIGAGIGRARKRVGEAGTVVNVS